VTFHQLFERDAHFFFYGARSVDVAGDVEEFGAGVSGSAE
jgi:hypothetical protein